MFAASLYKRVEEFGLTITDVWDSPFQWGRLGRLFRMSEIVQKM